MENWISRWCDEYTRRGKTLKILPLSLFILYQRGNCLFGFYVNEFFMNSMKLVIHLHSLYWSIHTKDESKRGTAFAFIFGVNWLWRCGVTASFGVFFHEIKCDGMKISWNSCSGTSLGPGNPSPNEWIYFVIKFHTTVAGNETASGISSKWQRFKTAYEIDSRNS